MDFTHIYQFIGIHWLPIFVSYFLFMAIVSGMPEPKDVNNIWYSWLFTTLHTLSGNLDKIWGKFLSTNGK